jgi:predicted MFS family arabinose efflux permease
MRRRTAIPIDSKRALAALAASNTLGVLALYVIPLIVGATVNGFDTSEGTAGIVSGWELGVMAAVSTLLAARYELLDLRRWTWIGALAYGVGSLLSLWSVTEGQWQIFLAARGVVGAGEGMLFAISSGLAAQTARPDRTFSWFAGSHIATSLLCFWALPTAMEWIGPAGAFVAMAAVGLLVIPLLLWTPDPPATRQRRSPEPPERLGMMALLLLLSVGSLNLGLNMLFPFTERIGVSIGFTIPEIGRILSWGAALGILGPITAGVLCTRTGRTLPLAFGVGFQIAGVFILVYVTSHLLWAVGYVVSATALMYFMPLLYGLVALYDRTGRVNAAAASVTAWASAAGPLLSGLVLIAGSSYRLIGWLTAVMYAAIFAFAYRPARAVDRERHARR